MVAASRVYADDVKVKQRDVNTSSKPKLYFGERRRWIPLPLVSAHQMKQQTSSITTQRLETGFHSPRQRNASNNV
ncbi:unnamed protein product [Pleuronectes platessa]|uniref:Uncharacterized protein n=1 Tax=Pleuronectes platessa TaxID=8262 RepID=A0A9N7Z6Q0_PLEPL|nr:unnamed protein product [Pleuronectes platessa]